MTDRLLVFLAGSTLAMGCHRRLKNAAPALDSVRPVLTVDSAATVRVPADEAAGPTSNPAIGISQLVVGSIVYTQSAKLEADLLASLETSDVAASVAGGVADGARDATLPFEVRDDGAHPLHIDVRAHGIVVADGHPALETELRLLLVHSQTDQRLYKTTHVCTTPLREGFLPDLPMLGPSEVTALKEMTELPVDWLGPMVEGHAADCAAEAMQWLAAHAGTGDKPVQAEDDDWILADWTM